MKIRSVALRVLTSLCLSAVGTIGWLFAAMLVGYLIWGRQCGQRGSPFLLMLSLMSLVLPFVILFVAFAVMTPRRRRRLPQWAPNAVPAARPVEPASLSHSDCELRGSLASTTKGATATVTVQLDEDDRSARREYLKRHSPHVKRMRMLTRCLVIVVILVIVVPVVFQDDPVDVRIVLAVTKVLIFLGVWIVFMKAVYWFDSRGETRVYAEASSEVAFAPTVFSVSPDCLSTDSGYETKRIPWQAITKVARDDEYIVLFLHAHEAFFVALRAFGCREDADRFFELANRYHSEAAASLEASPTPIR